MNFELESRITYPDLLNNLSQSFKTLKHDDLRSFILLFVTISKKPAPLLSYTCALPASSALFAPHAWPFVPRCSHQIPYHWTRKAYETLKSRLIKFCDIKDLRLLFFNTLDTIVYT